MKMSLRHVDCPLCGADDFRPIIAAHRFDDVAQAERPYDEISIGNCGQCGLLFINPQISLKDSPDYTDHHYYRSREIARRHDLFQRHKAPFKWCLLEQRIPWNARNRFPPL